MREGRESRRKWERAGSITYIYIYIYEEREKKRERGRKRDS